MSVTRWSRGSVIGCCPTFPRSSPGQAIRGTGGIAYCSEGVTRSPFDPPTSLCITDRAARLASSPIAVCERGDLPRLVATTMPSRCENRGSFKTSRTQIIERLICLLQRVLRRFSFDAELR